MSDAIRRTLQRSARLLPVVLLLALAPSPARAAETDAGALAIVGAHVIPMTGPFTLDDTTVRIRDGRIVELGPSSEVTPRDDERVIDAAGRVLMPGLTEMHAHVPPQSSNAMPASYQNDVLTLFVAHGVTRIRGMLGEPQHLELRDAIAAGEILGPTLVTSGPSFNGRSTPDPASAERRVREQAAAGYDFLKMHPGLSRPTFDRIARTAGELDIPFAGHVSVGVGLLPTLAAGQVTVDHLDGYLAASVPTSSRPPPGAASFFGLGLAPWLDDDLRGAAIAATVDAGAAVVPTQTLLDNAAAARRAVLAGADATTPFADRAQLAWVPRQLRARYERAVVEFGAGDFDPETFIAARRALLRDLHRAGVPVLLGSDAPQIMNVPGASAHRELQALVDAGLHPLEALMAGTRAPAAFLERTPAGELPRSGVIAPGAEASLVLLDGNPIVDIAATQRIAGVVLRGRWIDRSALDELLSEVEEHSR